jgi:hypothetical protein
VAYGAGAFFSLSGGTVHKSTDCATWTAVPGTLAQNGSGIFAVGGELFITADGNTIYSSPNGTTWTPHQVAGSPSDTIWVRVAFANNYLGAQAVAPTGRPQGTLPSSLVARSVDGAAWTASSVLVGGQALPVLGLGSDGNRFVLELGEDALYSSTDLASFTELGALPIRVQRPQAFALGTVSEGWAFNPTTTPPRLVGVGDEGTIITLP